MYWYSDDRSIQFNFNRQKSGLNKAFYGHRSSPVFLTNILKYRLDHQLGKRNSCFMACHGNSINNTNAIQTKIVLRDPQMHMYPLSKSHFN